MMVSEYVTEIFEYLKVVEVRFSGCTFKLTGDQLRPCLSSHTFSPAPPSHTLPSYHFNAFAYFDNNSFNSYHG